MSGTRTLTPAKEAAERTVEDESGLEGVLLPIHLASDDAEEGFGINHDLDSVLLDDLVKLFGLVDVFEVVTHAGATLVADADPDEFRLWLIEQALDPFDSSFALLERGQSATMLLKAKGASGGSPESVPPCGVGQPFAPSAWAWRPRQRESQAGSARDARPVSASGPGSERARSRQTRGSEAKAGGAALRRTRDTKA